MNKTQSNPGNVCLVRLVLRASARWRPDLHLQPGFPHRTRRGGLRVSRGPPRAADLPRAPPAAPLPAAGALHRRLRQALPHRGRPPPVRLPERRPAAVLLPVSSQSQTTNI